jgi:hypothetical protein
VAPYTILNNVLRELKRAIDACGNRLVLVMEVLPRFLLRPCSEDTGHCSNTRPWMWPALPPGSGSCTTWRI